MRHHIRALALAAGLAALATPAAAQDDVFAPKSHTRGFVLGGFASASAIQVEDSDAENGIGGGLHLGFGFNDRISVFLRGTTATINSPDEGFDDYTLRHADLGVRYTFGTSAAALRPYVAGALSGRSLKFDLGGQTLETRGPALTGSGGVEYFISPTFAIDAVLLISYGTFNVGRVDDSDWVDLEDDSLNGTASRLELGFTWHP